MAVQKLNKQGYNKGGKPNGLNLTYALISIHCYLKRVPDCSSSKGRLAVVDVAALALALELLRHELAARSDSYRELRAVIMSLSLYFACLYKEIWLA